MPILSVSADQADFHVHRTGGIVLFFPRTDRAFEEIDLCDIEPWQWMGNSFACEAAYAAELASNLSEAGCTFADVPDTAETEEDRVVLDHKG